MTGDRTPLLVPSFLQPASVAMYLASGAMAILTLVDVVSPVALTRSVDPTYVGVWALLMGLGAATGLQGALSQNLGDQQRSWLESWGAAVLFVTWSTYNVSIVSAYGFSTPVTVLLTGCVAGGCLARSVQAWRTRRLLRAAQRSGVITSTNTLADPRDRGEPTEEA